MDLETMRLFLRPPRESDAAPMTAIRNSAFVMRFNGMTIWSEAQVRESLFRAGGATLLVLERKADGAVLGQISYEEDSLRYRVRALNLGYYLGEEYARQGYMKEALGAVIDALFEGDASMELVSARVFVGNVASERLLESLGFSKEGVFRRCVRDYSGNVFDDQAFSLLREEWRTREG